MNEELRLNSEELDAIDSFHKFRDLGFEHFYKKEYDGVIKNQNKMVNLYG